MTDTYLQVVLSLAGVAGLIYLLAFLMRRKQGGDDFMKVVAYQSFGQRKGIAAMKIGSDIHIVGVTPNDIKLLKTYEEIAVTGETGREINNKLKRLRSLRENLDEV